jgi:hypothetical protein
MYSASNLAKPRASIRSLSNQHDIPRRIVWRVFHFKHKKRAYHLQVRDYLNNIFGTHAQAELHRNVGRHAPPDLTPLHFFAWSFRKCKVPDLHDLRQLIYEAAQALTPNMLRDVFRATVERWAQCHEMEGWAG